MSFDIKSPEAVQVRVAPLAPAFAFGGDFCGKEVNKRNATV